MKQTTNDKITIRSIQIMKSRDNEITRSRDHEITNKVSESAGVNDVCTRTRACAHSSQRTRVLAPARREHERSYTARSEHERLAATTNAREERTASKACARADFAMVARCYQTRDTIECSKDNGDTGSSVQLVGACKAKSAL